MQRASLIAVALTLAVLPAAAKAQRNLEKEEDFVAAKPAVGDSLPALTVYTSDGQPFKTSDLHGHYTVLTFGCLT
jgi:cytochrome oxidase Cu insertion factor (SCO1/SenC/PrrC family)